MGWSTEQQNRLQKELEILSFYFPKFDYVYVGQQLCLEGWMRTNSNNDYKIRLYVTADLPYSVQDVVITDPNPITDYSGTNLTSLGPTAAMHLLTPKDGLPKICTYRPANWNANVTFYKVLVKVRIWLEALDGH